MPLGFTEDGFDPDHVAKLGVSVEAFNRPDEVVTGIIELRNLRVAFGPRVPSAVLPPDRKILAGETTRAAAMRARLRARLGDATAGHMAFGVNLAWATARSAEGEDLQLYGRLLDAGTPWGNVLWDLGTPAVVDSLRADFRAISATFGPRPLIRLWLFADMRSGISFDARGMPLGISKRAEANMRVLLRLARDENVRLLPVLLDFGIADGVEHSGPDAAWTVGEHLDVVTDAAKRTRLAALFEAFVRLFRDDPAVVAWEVMNEPENAAAAVTPEHFADLQRLLATLVDAVHRAGELATIGHRNPIDARRFMRGRVATDLGQAHHYPMLETRPNPSLFGTRMGDVFGALPAGWGECQVRPQAVAEQVGAARAAGHSFLLFWSWRGDQDSGDGFAVKPYADEIKRAVRALKQGDDARHAP